MALEIRSVATCRVARWRRALVAAALMTAASGPAMADCMEDVRQLTGALGLSPNAPLPAGPPAAEPPATELRGNNTIAVRRSEVLALLQSARAASAQGNEDECNAQMAKARAVLQERQP